MPSKFQTLASGLPPMSRPPMSRQRHGAAAYASARHAKPRCAPGLPGLPFTDRQRSWAAAHAKVSDAEPAAHAMASIFSKLPAACRGFIRRQRALHKWPLYKRRIPPRYRRHKHGPHRGYNQSQPAALTRYQSVQGWRYSRKQLHAETVPATVRGCKHRRGLC